MKYLSQRDNQWAQVSLGRSRATVGRYGCTTTCISMLTDYFGYWHSPKDLAKEIIQYTYHPKYPKQSEGLILWPSVDNTKCMKFEKRLYGRKDDEILISLADPKKAVIFEVNGCHWVVGVKKTMFGNDYWIIDPWDGKKKTLTEGKYRITGSAHFIKKS